MLSTISKDDERNPKCDRSPGDQHDLILFAHASQPCDWSGCKSPIARGLGGGRSEYHHLPLRGRTKDTIRDLPLLIARRPFILPSVPPPASLSIPDTSMIARLSILFLLAALPALAQEPDWPQF